jgi:hypothetical protein
MRRPHPPHLLSSSRVSSVDGLTEVWLEAALLCRPRHGRCHGTIAGIRECAGVCQRTLSCVVIRLIFSFCLEAPSVDGLTEVWREAALICWPRCGR